MKITELLKEDHEEVRETFRRLVEEELEEDEREQILAECTSLLENHSVIEERIFYPDLEAGAGVPSEVKRAYADHHDIHEAIERLRTLGADEDVDLEDAIDGLRDMVERHLEDEEQNLFPVAEKSLGEARLEDAGAEAQDLKERLESGDEVIEPEEVELDEETGAGVAAGGLAEEGLVEEEEDEYELGVGEEEEEPAPLA